MTDDELDYGLHDLAIKRLGAAISRAAEFAVTEGQGGDSNRWSLDHTGAARRSNHHKHVWNSTCIYKNQALLATYLNGTKSWQ